MVNGNPLCYKTVNENPYINIKENTNANANTKENAYLLLGRRRGDEKKQVKNSFAKK